MRRVLVSMTSRVLCELPAILLFWLFEVILIGHFSPFPMWELCTALLFMNVGVVSLCDLLDQLVDYITE